MSSSIKTKICPKCEENHRKSGKFCSRKCANSRNWSEEHKEKLSKKANDFWDIKDIDGDSTNNDKSNFRLVCPNCDSQLPTFKSKNKGKGRKYDRHYRSE